MEVRVIHDVNMSQADETVGLETEPAGERLLPLVLESLETDKGEDVVVIDLGGKSAMADHMVIVSGRSSRQVCAMAENLRERLKAAGTKDVAAEGITRGDWVLIDAGDVIIHLFRPAVRSFYNLEKMWGAPVAETAPAEAALA